MYQLENKDTSLDQLSVGMANVEQSAVVETDASLVTMAVCDDEELNLVNVEASAGDRCSVTLSSDLKSAGDCQTVEVKGTGTGSPILAATCAGRTSFNNWKGASLSINGESVALTGASHALSAGNVSLAYDSCTYDGTAHEPKVTVTMGGTTLVEDEDFVVKYRKNIEAGTATALVVGFGNGYSGHVELPFTIAKGARAITAAGKTVQVGRSVALGAKVTGGATLAYRSSDPGVAAVSAAGVVTGRKAGKATITAAGDENWAQATKTVTVTVKRASNPLVVKPKAKTVRVSLVKAGRKAQKIPAKSWLKVTKKGQEKVNYANASSSKAVKKFKVNAKTGAITVPKGTRRGTYAVKVRVKAAGNKIYLPVTKTVSFKVVVR